MQRKGKCVRLCTRLHTWAPVCVRTKEKKENTGEADDDDVKTYHRLWRKNKIATEKAGKKSEEDGQTRRKMQLPWRQRSNWVLTSFLQHSHTSTCLCIAARTPADIMYCFNAPDPNFLQNSTQVSTLKWLFEVARQILRHDGSEFKRVHRTVKKHVHTHTLVSVWTPGLVAEKAHWHTVT